MAGRKLSKILRDLGNIVKCKFGMGFVVVNVFYVELNTCFLCNHTWKKEDSFMMISGLEADMEFSNSDFQKSSSEEN